MVNPIAIITHWFDRHVGSLAREFRVAFLPPLMVYVAAGVSGLTSIVGTFFVKDFLGLSASMLAAIGFWAGIPWALKMPMGHLVDLLWRYKAWFVWLGASLIAVSLLIMLSLLRAPDAMRTLLSAETWYILASLLAPVGYMMQDTVADAMTVEAVPFRDAAGAPVPDETRRIMNTTMQMLGRVAIISGGVLVSLANVILFAGVDQADPVATRAIYIRIYELALAIPVISIGGVLLARWIKRRRIQTLVGGGMAADQARILLEMHPDPAEPNWWILSGSTVFVLLTVTIGLSPFTYGQEAIFLSSFSVISFLMWRLVRELEPAARHTLVGTALIIFVFRALPGPGAGSTWWMIDELKFDQGFLARLSLIASVLTLIGLFGFRRLMAEKSMAYIISFLTLAGFILALPTVGMYYGLHHWTAQLTHGVVDARFIALVDTALESPLGQISMVPLLAWIANSAPAHLKATYFAVMASFTNLALSAAQLGTKYLNQVFVVTREVVDPNGSVTTPADYSQLGTLLIIVTALSLFAPLAAIGFTRLLKMKSA